MIKDLVPDIIDYDLKILFVGFNPGLRSGEIGHHFAGKNNRFWKLLYASELTPCLLQPEEDIRLLEWGLGITNIVSRPTRQAAELTKEDYIAGREILKQKVEIYKPQMICYVGKGVYEKFSLRRNSPWGMQQENVVKGVLDYVAPSSSGLVRMKFEEQLRYYKEARDISIN